MRPVLILFIVIPIAEMLLLIKIGSTIGAAPTIFLVLLTAVIGVGLLKSQGLATIHLIQARLAAGEIPAIELIEGAMLLVGGALLLTPGFVTDTIGFSLLIPISRRILVRFLLDKHLVKSFHPASNRSFNSYQDMPESKSSVTIEGEFRDDDHQ